MEFKQFNNMLIDALKEKLPDVELSIVEVIKNNDSVLTGINCKNSSNIAPTIYTQDYYTAYTNGATLESIIDSFISTYNAYKKENIFDMSDIRDYSNIKLTAKVINYGANKKMLHNQDILYKIIADDLAVIPQININLGTIDIKAHYLDLWDITEDKLFSDVYSFLYDEEYSIESMWDFMHMPYIPGEPKFFILNCDSKYGAKQILNKRAMDELLEILNSNELVIIPCSISEVIVTDNTPEAVGFGQIIKEVNASVIAREDVLSDHPYLYKSGEIISL